MANLTHIMLDDIARICRKPVKEVHTLLTAFTRARELSVDDWLEETIVRQKGRTGLARARTWSIPGHIAIAFMARVGVPDVGLKDYMSFVGAYYATAT
jgi:hypothetical protein